MTNCSLCRLASTCLDMGRTLFCNAFMSKYDMEDDYGRRKDAERRDKERRRKEQT
jgi:hypothetical protein